MKVEYMGSGWGASMPLMLDVLFSAVLLQRYTTKASIIDHLVSTFLSQKEDLDASELREAVEKAFPDEIVGLQPSTDLEAYFLLRY